MRAVTPSATWMMGAVREPPIGGLEGAKPLDKADGQFTEKGVAWLWELTVVNIRRGKLTGREERSTLCWKGTWTNRSGTRSSTDSKNGQSHQGVSPCHRLCGRLLSRPCLTALASSAPPD
jgi:hypothetical protein